MHYQKNYKVSASALNKELIKTKKTFADLLPDR